MRIKRDEDDEGILIDDRFVDAEDMAGGLVWVRLEHIDELGDVAAEEIEEGIALRVHSSDGFGTYLFYEVQVSKPPGEAAQIDFVVHHPNKYWEGRFGLATLLKAMSEEIGHHDGLSVGDIELADDWKRLVVTANADPSKVLSGEITAVAKELSDVHHEATVALSGFVWKPVYETDERQFCTEVLAPLLRRMGFISVHYMQGAREYGKDFTFSEPTKFGHLRHFGLQAKCGNVRGNVNGDIDELVGQFDDAFKVPYVDVSAGDERRISTFVVAISGRYTENAKEKIAHKVPSELRGSLIFLDRERILELVERHWVK